MESLLSVTHTAALPLIAQKTIPRGLRPSLNRRHAASCSVASQLGVRSVIRRSRIVGSGDSRLLASSSSKEDEAAPLFTDVTSSAATGDDALVKTEQGGEKAIKKWPLDVPGLQGMLVLGAGLPFLPGVDLSGPGSVIEAMSVLALIVAVHEAGHFLAARTQGIHVSKFSVGFGPIIFKYQAPDTQVVPDSTTEKLSSSGKPAWLQWLSSRGAQEAAPKAPPPVPGVEYSLRLIPLGGYVAFPDDDENNTTFASDDPDLLKNRPVLDRIKVVSAGVIANLIFAYAILFTQVNTVGLLVQQLQPGVVVPHVVQGGAGEKGGLKDGDIILEVQGQKLPASESSVADLVGAVKDRPNQDVTLVVSRNGELQTLTLRPNTATDGSGRINVQLSPHVEVTPLKPKNVVDASVLAGSEVVRLGSLVTDGLRQLFLNFGEAAERLSGPVAIVAVGAEVARTSASGLFQFAAIINLNLAVVNILPLPALDGGFLLLLLVEAARGGRKLPQDVEQVIMSSGLLLLLTAGIFLIVRDTLNLAALL